MESKMINGYSLISKLGQGSYGRVYKAQKDGEFYAIKEFFIDYKQITAECKNEVNILKSLDHPNVIRYVQDFVLDDIFYIVTEYAPNGTLQELIDDD
jgi:serine/threonine protein kinase